MDPDPTPEQSADDQRQEFICALHALANFLWMHPDAPLPLGDMVRHYRDADDFDRGAAVIGGTVEPSSSGYEACTRRFGPIRYGVQTDGRRAQQVKRREEAIAQRERELGLGTEDIGQAA